jgi:GNAT superfamily N-acetyltransferase
VEHMSAFKVRPVEQSDIPWIARSLKKHWLSRRIVSRGKVFYPENLPGFIAWQRDRRVGLVTYRIQDDELEIVTLNSIVEGVGIGSALMGAVRALAVSANCRRIWLATTNDNIRALRFYQRIGFVLVAVHRNAVEQSRRLKPEIPLIGANGIPLRDEIELEMIL